jgi:hypothetical protein
MAIMMYQNIRTRVWTESKSRQKKISSENLTDQSVVQSKNRSANWYGRKVVADCIISSVGVPPDMITSLSFSISNIGGIAAWHVATAPTWQTRARKMR